MKVKIHRLFEYLLETTTAEPEAILGFSQATPPRLGDFLDDLDPALSLDWSNQSFLGLPALRENVRDRAELTDAVAVDDILITAGAAEANFLAISQLVQPGDEIVVETPGWPQALVLGDAIGATVRRLPRREEDGWRIDEATLTRLISSRTRLIFLSNPNNPTGQWMDEAALRRVVATAARVGAYVLVDEVYAGLEWDRPRAPSVVTLYERGITTGGVSKALGLQGLRIGWLICRDRDVVRAAMILRENTSEIMNVLGEAVAEIALRPHRYATAIARARADGVHNLALLDEFIAQHDALSWQRPQAGLIGLARLHLPLDGDALARRLMAPPYKTFLLPGSAYDCPQHIRLGVGGGPEAALDRGLTRLAALLNELDAEGDLC